MWSRNGLTHAGTHAEGCRRTRGTSRCARAKHGHTGVLSEAFVRTPVRLTPGCPAMGEGPSHIIFGKVS